MARAQRMVEEAEHQQQPQGTVEPPNPTPLSVECQDDCPWRELETHEIHDQDVIGPHKAKQCICSSLQAPEGLERRTGSGPQSRTPDHDHWRGAEPHRRSPGKSGLSLPMRESSMAAWRIEARHPECRLECRHCQQRDRTLLLTARA
ncbi:hypothetical protein L1887_48624 [Cichorium endivia]|nr:hypothetical protein L1887_48624 [Cichorium endivia]